MTHWSICPLGHFPCLTSFAASSEFSAGEPWFGLVSSPLGSQLKFLLMSSWSLFLFSVMSSVVPQSIPAIQSWCVGVCPFSLANSLADCHGFCHCLNWDCQWHQGHSSMCDLCPGSQVHDNMSTLGIVIGSWTHPIVWLVLHMCLCAFTKLTWTMFFEVWCLLSDWCLCDALAQCSVFHWKIVRFVSAHDCQLLLQHHTWDCLVRRSVQPNSCLVLDHMVVPFHMRFMVLSIHAVHVALWLISDVFHDGSEFVITICLVNSAPLTVADPWCLVQTFTWCLLFAVDCVCCFPAMQQTPNQHHETCPTDAHAVCAQFNAAVFSCQFWWCCCRVLDDHPWCLSWWLTLEHRNIWSKHGMCQVCILFHHWAIFDHDCKHESGHDGYWACK